MTNASGRAPLPTLLSHALLDLTREYDALGARVPTRPKPSIVLWSNALRLLDGDGDGVLLTELPKRARVSRRAIAAIVTGMERDGWIEVVAGEGRGKKVVRLTPGGRAGRELWAPLVGESEARWTGERGAARVAALRAALERLVARFPLELPHFPLGYGPVDDSITGGSTRAGKPGPPRIPSSGQDWSAVVRGEGDTVSGLPLTALLSQALVAFTIDYEQERVGSLPLGATVMATWTGDTKAVRDLPARLGLTGSGTSGLERHGVVTVHGEGREKIATLTDRGRYLRDAYRRVTAEIEKRWDDEYGDDARALRHALEALDPLLAPDLPAHPTINWMGALTVY